MKLVMVQFVLVESQLNALLAIKRAQVKGWGVPDEIPWSALKNLGDLGFLTGLDFEKITLAGELVISSSGLDSVVMI